MESIERGCVYFFKHIGLTPVKIGYSTNESPINRFESFKTYAPYGSELLGFIITKESKELETILHKRFSANRLKGEWFEISKEDVEKVVSFYSNIEDIKEKNEFEIQWAKYKNTNFEENDIDIFDFKIFDKTFSKNKTETYNQRLIINQRDLMKFLNVDKMKMNQIIKKYKLKIGTHYTGSFVKKGYFLYTIAAS